MIFHRVTSFPLVVYAKVILFPLLIHCLCWGVCLMLYLLHSNSQLNGCVWVWELVCGVMLFLFFFFLLLFANDHSLLLCRASAMECGFIKRTLHAYQLASGQCVNFNSNQLCVSPNFSLDRVTFLVVFWECLQDTRD